MDSRQHIKILARDLISRRWLAESTSPGQILWLCSPVGRGLVLLAAGFALFVIRGLEAIVPAAVVLLASGFPKYRWPLLSVCSLVVFLMATSPSSWIPVSICFSISFLILFAARTFPRRRLQLMILLVLSLFSLILWEAGRPPNLVHESIRLFSFLVWSLLLAIRYQNEIKSPILYQMCLLSPFWQSPATALPVPSGIRYLEEVEAVTTRSLMISQFRGARLMIWAGLLEIIHRILSFLMFDLGRLPTMLELIRENPLQGKPLTFSLFAILSAFSLFAIRITVIWGVFVALARLCGFNAHRAIYSPFSATSINNFWPRIEYYYVKSNLSLFLQPLLRLSVRLRSPRSLRPLFVVAAIVFCGTVFHFFRDATIILKKQNVAILHDLGKNVFYYTVLGGLVVANFKFSPEGQGRTSGHSAKIKVLLFLMIVFLGFYFHRISGDAVSARLKSFLYLN